MESQQERERQAEAARSFDAALRERLAANRLTPRVSAFLAPETEEANAPAEGEQD